MAATIANGLLINPNPAVNKIQDCHLYIYIWKIIKNFTGNEPSKIFNQLTKNENNHDEVICPVAAKSIKMLILLITKGKHIFKEKAYT